MITESSVEKHLKKVSILNSKTQDHKSHINDQVELPGFFGIKEILIPRNYIYLIIV